MVSCRKPTDEFLTVCRAQAPLSIFCGIITALLQLVILAENWPVICQLTILIYAQSSWTDNEISHVMFSESLHGISSLHAKLKTCCTNLLLFHLPYKHHCPLTGIGVRASFSKGRGWATFAQKYFDSTQKTAPLTWLNSVLSTKWNSVDILLIHSNIHSFIPVISVKKPRFCALHGSPHSTEWIPFFVS